MVDTDATTIIGNTMSAVASEFKKNEGAQTCQTQGRNHIWGISILQ